MRLGTSYVALLRKHGDLQAALFCCSNILEMVLFTPATALVGGLVLGTAAAGKLLLTGRVLGISGALKGFVQGDVTSWRVAFVLGLGGGALAAARSVPAGSAFDVLPATFTVTCCMMFCRVTLLRYICGKMQ